MNDSQWQVARLDDIERRGRDIPVREHLGIHAFGINAYTPGEDGTLINEHDEAGSGQEELYIVLGGKATFEVDGEAIDAPPGTLVFVGPESRRKATGDGTVLAVGATPGEQASWCEKELPAARHRAFVVFRHTADAARPSLHLKLRRSTPVFQNHHSSLLRTCLPSQDAV